MRLLNPLFVEMLLRQLFITLSGCARTFRQHILSSHRGWFRYFQSTNSSSALFVALAKNSDLRPTGIPSHVHLKLRLAEIERKQDEVLASLSTFGESVENVLRDGLNDFALIQGHMTYDNFKDLLAENIAALQKQLYASLNKSLEGEKGMEINNSTQHSGQDVYMWDGMLHLVPQDFEFPSVTVRQAFILWACGNQEKRLPAFRFLAPRDMPSINMRKRLSDFSAIMRPLENAAKEGAEPVWPQDSSGKWKGCLTAEEASVVFDTVEDAVSIPGETIWKKKKKKKRS